jgi:tetratricopeptide (TPR) repeat protein
MNRDNFFKLLKNCDAGLNGPEIRDLKEIIENYPYFQAAHTLLAKAYLQQDSIHYDKTLKRAAAATGDRAVLYRFLYGTLADKKKNKEDELPQMVTDPHPVTEELAVNEIHPVEAAFVEVPEKKNGYISNETPFEEVYTATAEKIDEEENDLSIKGSDEEENEIENPAVTSSEALSDENLIHPDEEKTKEKIDVSSGELSFTEWLKVFNRQNPAVSKYSSKLDKSDNDPKQIETIIEKFIREEPRIRKAKSEFYSPVNMAAKSVSEEEIPVSETLAEIIYKQGNYKKALKIYEKLCLIYPEKCTYFAERIHEIKNNL